MKKSFKNIKNISTIIMNTKLSKLSFIILVLSLSSILAQTAPVAPVSYPASNVQNNRFDANWTKVSSATGYYLDVARDFSFTSFVTGFQNLNVGDVASYTVTGLTPNTEYFFRVRAYNTYGTSLSSSNIELITGPAAPIATAATLVTRLNFVANWNAVTSATGYYFDLATDSLFTNFVNNYNNRNVGNYTTLTIDSVLTTNTNYYYRVRAYNTYGTSNNSNFISVITLPIPPLAPDNLGAINIQVGRVLLSWESNSTSETGFKIERRIVNQTDFAQIDSVAHGVITYYDTKVGENITYEYRVRAYNRLYNSDYSNVIQITTLYYDVLDPSNLTATATQVGKVVLNWKDNSNNEVGFNILRKLASQSTFSALDRVPANVTTYTDNTVSDGVTYNYMVDAYNTNTTSTYSNIATVTALSSSIAAPSGLSALAPSAGWVVLSWTDNSTNESGFKVERKLSTESNFVLIGSVPQNATTYWDSTASPKKSYDYRVKAYNSSAESSYSNVATVITKPSAIDLFVIPTEYKLEQNFPNPFNPSTVIKFSLPKSSFVKLTIYNMLGEKVLDLINEELPAGNYYREFNGINLSSGVYIYTINTKEFYQSKKMMLLK